MHDVLIIGGGIGGLAAAVALQRQGTDAQVYEATPELHAVGLGIWVPPNAMSVLERLSLAGEVIEAGLALDRLEVRDLEEGVLQAMDGAEVMTRWGHPTVAIRRSELQRVLATALQPGTLHLGKCMQYFEDRGTDVRAHFTDGTEARGKLLNGAGGLHSAVRRQLFPYVSLRYSGQTCFRGLAEFRMPEALQQTA